MPIGQIEAADGKRFPFTYEVRPGNILVGSASDIPHDYEWKDAYYEDGSRIRSEKLSAHLHRDGEKTGTVKIEMKLY